MPTVLERLRKGRITSRLQEMEANRQLGCLIRNCDRAQKTKTGFLTSVALSNVVRKLMKPETKREERLYAHILKKMNISYCRQLVRTAAVFSRTNRVIRRWTRSSPPPESAGERFPLEIEKKKGPPPSPR